MAKLFDPGEVRCGRAIIETPDGTEIRVAYPIDEHRRWSKGSVNLLFGQVVIDDQYGVRGKLSGGDVVIDVGASIGSFTWLAASQGARVYAFEPNPKEYHPLVELINMNHLSAEPIQMAVGEVGGTARFNCGYASTLGDGQVLTDDMEIRHVPAEDGGDEVAIDVPVTTIDAFCEQRNLKRLRLVKVDTEGYESRVLAGAAESIRRFHPVLLLASYHRRGDDSALAHVVSEIAPSYRFHSYAIDLPNTDPVLVCLPPEFEGQW